MVSSLGRVKHNDKILKGAKMKNIFYKIVILAFLLNGCAKDAMETATESSLNQVSAIEAQIKKECPQAKIDKEMDALRASINTQLAICESQKATLQERNNTLWVILFGILVVFIVAKWEKIKAKVIK